MNNQALREKAIPDLRKELVALQKEVLMLRMQSAGQVSPHRFRVIRRQVARIKTIINEKERIL